MQAAVINVCFTFLLAGSAGFFISDGTGSICSRLREPHIPPPRLVSLGRKIQTLMYLVCRLDSLRYTFFFFFTKSSGFDIRILKTSRVKEAAYWKNPYKAFIVQPQLAELQLSKMMC